MFKCHICVSTEFRMELVSEIFKIDGKPVLMENIPAQVCARCAVEIFSRETTEKVRLIVHGRKKPIKSVQMDVFAYT
ncbi:MAG: YgiT-type zinc finger protein [Chloroflexi bacterium]|nr:YgiT-type zinc finger protein [Chloroflexota bacterium]